MANKFVSSHFESIIDLGHFVDLVMAGFSYAQVAQRMSDFVERQRKRRDEPTSAAELEEQKRRHEELAEFSRVQESRGFPYLYSTASVRLWSILEAFVDDVLEFMLANLTPEKASSDLLSVEGSLLEFSMMSSEDQAIYLLARVKEMLSSRLKLGVGRFEAPLGYVGLSGGVNDAVRRSLFELSEVRNIVVHKNSSADSRLIENCPWMNLEIGEPIDITREVYEIYVQASLWYLVEMGERMRERHPDLPLEYEDEASNMRDVQAHQETTLESLWAARTGVAA